MREYKYKKQIQLGWASDGRQIRKWIYADSKKELEQLKHRLQEEFSNSSVYADMTFSEYYTHWFKTYKSKKEKNTQRMYKEAYNHLDNIKYLRMKKITRTDIQDIINENWEHPSTCEKLSVVLNAVFNGAVEDGLILKKPTKNLTLPERPEVERRVLTSAEVDRVKELLSMENNELTPRNKMILGMFYYFGLRPEEVRALMPSDFSRDYSEATIQRALAFSDNERILKTTKTKKVRVMPVPDDLKPLLKAYIRFNKSTFMFLTLKNEMLTKSAYKSIWRSIKTKMGVDDIVPYTFRYNYCTTLYYAGITPKKAAYLMGNSVEMVLKIYAQIDDARENIEGLRQIL